MERCSDHQTPEDSSNSVDLNCLYEPYDSISNHCPGTVFLNSESTNLLNSENESLINAILHSKKKGFNILFSESRASHSKHLRTDEKLSRNYEKAMQLSHTPMPFTQIGLSRDEYTVELENLLLQKQRHVDTLESELDRMKQFYEDKYHRLLLENSKSGKVEQNTQEEDMLREEVNKLLDINRGLVKQLNDTNLSVQFLENSIQVQKEDQGKESNEVLEENKKLGRDLVELQNQIFQMSLSKAQTEQEYLDYKEISAPLETISTLITEHEDLTIRYEELQNQCAGIIAEAERLNEENQRLTSLHESYQTEIQDMKNEYMSELEKHVRREEAILKLFYIDTLKLETFDNLQAEVNTIKQLETDLLCNIKSKDSKIHGLQEMIENLEIQKKELEEKSVKQQNSKKIDKEALEEVYKLRTLTLDQDSEIISLNKQLNELTIEKLEKDKENTELKKSIEKHYQLKQELCQLYTDYDNLRIDYSKLSDVNSNLTATIKSLERENNSFAFRCEKLEKDHVLFENQQKLQNVVYKYLTQSCQPDAPGSDIKNGMLEEIQNSHAKIKELTLDIIDLKSKVRDYERNRPKLPPPDIDSIAHLDRSDDEMQLESVQECIQANTATISNRSVVKLASIDTISNQLPPRVRQLISGKEARECISDSPECH